MQVKLAHVAPSGAPRVEFLNEDAKFTAANHEKLYHQENLCAHGPFLLSEVVLGVRVDMHIKLFSSENCKFSASLSFF